MISLRINTFSFFFFFEEPVLVSHLFVLLIGINWVREDHTTIIPDYSLYIQSTLDISKSKGPSETLQDICTLTYQICGTEENTNRTTKFHK